MNRILLDEKSSEVASSSHATILNILLILSKTTAVVII